MSELTGKRKEAYEHLKAALILLNETDAEDLQDNIADVMDAVSDWCSPGAGVVFPDESSRRANELAPEEE